MTTGYKEYNLIPGSRPEEFGEILANSKRIVAGDCSPGIPRPLGYELLSAARFAVNTRGEIISSFYPSDSIGVCVAGTEYSLMPDAGKVQLHLDTGLVERYYIPVLGPYVDQGGEYLPATVYTVDCCPFPRYVMARLQEELQILRRALYPESQEWRITILDMMKIPELEGICVRDIYDLFRDDVDIDPRTVAMTWTCPECSVKKGKQVRHAVDYNCSLYVSSARGAYPKSPECQSVRNLIAYSGGDLLGVPLDRLLAAGFRFRGLLLYLVATYLLGKEGTCLAMRDYSKSAGIVSSVSSLWEPSFALSTRTYVTKISEGRRVEALSGDVVKALAEDSRGSVRDQTTSFVSGVPLVSDGREYEYNISNGTISVRE